MAQQDLHLARCSSFKTGHSHVSQLPEGNDPVYSQLGLGRALSWHGPSCCRALFEHLKSTNDDLFVLGPMPWASSVCKDLQQQCQHTKGAQCWEDPAAEPCRMCWSSILVEQHVTQLKSVLMQPLVTHTRNPAFKPSSKLMTEAPCCAPGASARYPDTQLGAPRQEGSQL